MQKKRLLSFLILGLLASVVAVQFVGVVSGQAPTSADFFRTIWDSWKTGGQLPEGFAKFLFSLIIGLLVYSTLDFMPGLKGEQNLVIRTLLAIVVGFLGGAYLLPGEVYAVLLSYSATGFTIGMVFPFLILMLFTWKLLEENPFNNTYLSKIVFLGIWGTWAWYLLNRLSGIYGSIFNIFKGSLQGIEVSSGLTIGFIAMFVITLLMIFIGLFAWKYSTRKAQQGKIQSETENVSKKMQGSRIYTDEQNKQFEAMGVK